ncbi:MAG: GH39 family glycosyl hydrolase [Aggregatilineales bacterium]
MNRSKRRSAFLIAVLIFIGLTSLPVPLAAIQTQATCSSPSGVNRFGVNEVLGWPGLYPPTRLELSLGLMEEAEIGWARVNWAWKDLQPQNGAFDYSHLDAVARVAAEHHIQLLPILTAVPAWASTAPDQLKAQYGNLSPVDRYRPKDMTDWLQYVRNVVERYDGNGVNDAPGSPRINYWEVWNEPNIGLFWPPTPNAAEYLALLKATYQAIKATDPTAKVVLGGLANAGFNADGSSYLQTLYDLGGAPYFDVVSIHLYSYPPLGIAPVVKTVDSVRSLMDAHGDKDKPLWLTEIGWSDAPNAWGAPTVSQDDVAAFLKAVYDAPLPADVIFWYNFRNIFANSPDVEHNFGLINANFTPKPAFKVYKALAAACARDSTEMF